MIVPPLHHVKSQLILLEIYQTKIPDIPNDFFHGFERLYYLIIFGCNLRAIPNLNGVSRSIVSIDLRENKIVHIDSFYRTPLDCDDGGGVLGAIAVVPAPQCDVIKWKHFTHYWRLCG